MRSLVMPANRRAASALRLTYFTPLSTGEMRAFVKARNLPDPERRIALSAGSPGLAISLDLEQYDRRDFRNADKIRHPDIHRSGG